MPAAIRLQAELADMREARIADMDAAGLDIAVLSPGRSGADLLPPASARSLAPDINDRLARAVR